MENRKEGETYTFYDGPPTANGKPHIGHVLTRVIKDMIPRYRTMKDIWYQEKPGGIHTDFRWNWKWKNCLDWMEKSRLRNMD